MAGPRGITLTELLATTGSLACLLAALVPAVVSSKGIQPLHVGALPHKIMLEHILPEWLAMERELETFATGDRSMLLWQVLDSHQTRSYEQATRVLADLLGMDGNEEIDARFEFPNEW